MQINYFNNYGGLIRDIKMKGNVLEGDIVLVRDPVEQNEVATKNYVDTVFSTLNVILINSGTLDITTLPALTGDVTSFPGTNQTLLANQGFSVGPQKKVTVNEKGIVIGIEALGNSDIPNLDWAKVTTDKPNNISGYGIVDALDSNGGDVSVNITLNANPSGLKEAATKGYVDALAVSNNSSSNPGDLIYKPTTITPIGFLRCNGAMIQITTYQALFDKIGHTGPNPGGGYFYLPDLTDQSHSDFNYYIKY